MAALGHGHAVLGEQLFSLVFEKVHVCVPAARARAIFRRGRVRPARDAINKPKRRHVPLPKNLDFVSLEVYGTLIDWETGIYEAFQKEAEKDGFTIDRDQLIPLFLETQREIMSGSYELYAEVLRRTAVQRGRGARLGARAGALELPAQQHPVLAAVPRHERPARPAQEEVPDRADLRTSTTSCSAPRGATSAPTSTWS